MGVVLPECRGALLQKMADRVALNKAEGDIAYFYDLGLYLEYVTKVVSAGIVACLGDDADRHRYSLEHALVRANAVGEWAATLDAALTGPAAAFFRPEAERVAREYTEKASAGDWRFAAVSLLRETAAALGIDAETGAKVSLRQFFQIGATIRNKSRGHGAPTSDQCSRACTLLAEGIETVVCHTQLLGLPWAHLHRNYSGKYRVSALLGDCSAFEYLKRSTDVRLVNGVYIWLGYPVQVPMVGTDPDLLDIFLPNGSFRGATFEELSYITNESRSRSAAPWTDPPGRLPTSETQGRPALEVLGNALANLPPGLQGYISRPQLERSLREQLLCVERHPIVSLTGPGGIGKTSLAIAALEELAHSTCCPYDVILWMSARDVDLLESGPKPVAPGVVTQRDISSVAAALLEPAGWRERGFSPERYFQSCLEEGAAGPTLFVLDNFETVQSPSDVFAWVDTYVRPPNKVLITTRFRDFAGDYPIHIGGMTDDEAQALIGREAARLGIRHLVDDRYRDELVRESDGHPYVIKILLGQAAKEQRAVKPERIVAGADHLLAALFERTYGNLTPSAQRVFLLLSSWRVFVPEVAVEAVLLRSGNERFDVAGALEELRQFSLVEAVSSDADEMEFVGVPLAAAMYGKRKLDVSPMKIAVEEDRLLLTEFGAGKREDVHRGVYPRIEKLVRAIAHKAGGSAEKLETYIPVLEYLASRVPDAYPRLAELVRETDRTEYGIERAKAYLRSFLETAEPTRKAEGWLRLADLCRAAEDPINEVHALGEAALCPAISAEDMSTVVNRLNNRVRELKGRRLEDAWSTDMLVLLRRVAAAMERRLASLSPTECSRLAWLFLNTHDEDRARRVAKIGIERDPDNEHCLNLAVLLGI